MNNIVQFTCVRPEYPPESEMVAQFTSLWGVTLYNAVMDQ